MRFAVITAVLAAALAVAPAAAQQKGGKKIQCWTDKNGARMCGDQVPPEYAGEKRDVMKGGRVVDTIDAAKTAEDREAEKRRKAAEEAQRKQAEYDRALLEMYRNQTDITAMRDDGIGVLITDHNVRETLKICDRAYIISEGAILLSGTPQEIVANPVARSSYLGKDFEL